MSARPLSLSAVCTDTQLGHWPSVCLSLSLLTIISSYKYWLALLDSRYSQQFLPDLHLSVYPSDYLYLSADFRSYKRLQWRGDRPGAYRRLRVYVIYFPAHCAGVTNMSLRYNLSSALKVCRRHQHMRSIAAPATKTTDLLNK